MIHNIEDKQKMYKRQSPATGMLSEEELARLIEQVEERELLHAPVHLKENILLQIRKQRQTVQKLQLFSYRAKVLVGMAAALTVLFLVPVGERDGVQSSGSIFGQAFRQELRQEQADMDEIQQGALERQEQIERTWQKYREEQERSSARENYFNGIENKIRNFRKQIF